MKEQEKLLPPNRYKELLRKVDLDQINLVECSAKLRRERFVKELTVIITDKAKIELVKDNSANILHTYSLIATKGSKRDYALKINCTFVVILSSSEVLTEEFLTTYIEINLKMITWPYFREFVQSISSRMNIPSLTLPFIKTP